MCVPANPAGPACVTQVAPVVYVNLSIDRESLELDRRSRVPFPNNFLVLSSTPLRIPASWYPTQFLSRFPLRLPPFVHRRILAWLFLFKRSEREKAGPPSLCDRKKLQFWTVFFVASRRVLTCIDKTLKLHAPVITLSSASEAKNGRRD